MPSEIINADVGQFYKPFNIGTAKPNWQSSKIPHHLFDVLDSPINLTVSKYRAMVLSVAKDVLSRNKQPIIVGGSLFYLKSLFYPPVNLPEVEPVSGTWDELNKIDPDRAKEIHPNDSYRINRALSIWRATKTKPSKYKPKFSVDFNSDFLFLSPDKDLLRKRINERCSLMINQGWVDEVRAIIDTNWEDFLKVKGLIGYPEIIDWIKSGGSDKEALINEIQNQTWDYARRQMIFWKSLKRNLDDDSSRSNYRCQTLTFSDNNQALLELTSN